MKTFKLKYLLGMLSFGISTILLFNNVDRYGYAVFIISLFMLLLSAILLCSDRHTHSVVDEKGKIIAKFGSEKEAMEFANNQARNVRVLMVHIQ